MAEEKSLADRLMDRIKKQNIINGIKAAFKKFPQARMILPFLKDGLETAKSETEKFLGDADHIIVIGRKQGITNVLVINSQKEFTISKGLKVVQDKTDPAVEHITSLDACFKEVYDSGIFELITEDDTKKFQDMKAGGFDGLKEMFKEEGQPQKSLEAGSTGADASSVAEPPVTEEVPEIGQEEVIQAPETINPPTT